MGAYEDATHTAVSTAIFDLMESMEPGAWCEACDTWGNTPSSIQGALVACLCAKLILIEVADDSRFRYKLSAAGEVLRIDRQGIAIAIGDGKDAPFQIARWQRQDTATPLRSKVVDEAIIGALCNCSGTWQSFDQAAATALETDAVKVLVRAGLVDSRVIVSCTQDGKPETLRLPFVISGPVTKASLERESQKQLVSGAPSTWFVDGKAAAAIRMIDEGVIDVRRNTQGEIAVSGIKAGEAETIRDEIWRRGMLNSSDRVPKCLRPEPPIIEANSGATELVHEVGAAATPSSMTWEEAAERLEILRSQGEAFKSRKKYADQFGCSPATVHKAIEKKESLHGWATKESPPVATRFDQAVENTPQRRESNPANVLEPADIEVVLARLLDEAKPEERAKLHALTPDQKRELAELVAKDPDRSNRVWGKKL